MRIATVLLALSLAACGRGPEGDLLAPLPKQTPKPKVKRDMSPVLDVAPERMREALLASYRLSPDGRFLAAVSEVPRLLGLPEDGAAEAAFDGGHWTVRRGKAVVGTLPELPGFGDYLEVLTDWARKEEKRVPKSAKGAAANEPGLDDDGSGFLWTRSVETLREVDRRWVEGGSSPHLAAVAARCLSRLSFQMADWTEIGDLIPARALGALAIARTRDTRAMAREELLLSHAMGYTRHAADVGRSLAASDPLRLFTEMADDALAARAAERGAPIETRYLALERVASRDEYTEWEAARKRLFRPEDEVALAPAMLHVHLQWQVEDNERREPVATAVNRALLEDLQGSAAIGSDRVDASGASGFEEQVEAALTKAAAKAKGPFWDGAAMEAWYRSAVYSGMFQAWPRSSTPTAQTLRAAASLPGPDVRAALTFLKDATGVGEPVLKRIAQDVSKYLNGDSPELTEAARLLVRRADARISHREDLVFIMRSSLGDLRLAEVLSRSILAELSDTNRSRKCQAALFVGDLETAQRLVLAPQCSAQEAISMLYAWSWYGFEPERLAAAFELILRRHPESWEFADTYIEFLRTRKELAKAYDTSAAWLARYGRPGATGYYHAHLVHAFNAIKLGRFEEGLKLYDAFAGGNNRRVRALALNGLGKKAEAEEIVRQAAEGSTFVDDLEVCLEILWKNGQDAAAVEALRKTGLQVTLATWTHTIAPVFGRAFLEAPAVRPVAAIRALREGHVTALELRDFAQPFAAAGKWETALRVQAAIEPPSAAGEERLLDSYTYMKEWKGKEAATQWLKQVVPPSSRNPIGIKAYNAGEYDLLWDFIETPDPNNHPEWVWLVRACAFARLAGKDFHRDELVGHYSSPSEDRYHLMGRYLLGLATEKELFAIATDQARRGEVAYYLAVKAHGEGRYEDASDWYRVCADLDYLHGPRSHAIRTLYRWVDLKQGLFRVRAEHL